ncbi:MAG: energy-coupling factor transporter ATPase [Eubacteriales bacterium]|nr:energy-coupling factor transporter ATPase [Eubacteriales bacterium]MDY2933743.1 energy-coupling factor transporter ATPase [Anaerovoracaceae bacterium]MEE0182187.1 energy-coupling factor transporter ATPase [Anaerovoracaceae bacterium]
MSVKVENLTHIYNEGLPHESVAVQDVSFSIEDGQIAGIIGHTGSGKSTLVQHLNGLIKPKTGSIYIDGENICDGKTVMREIRKKVGLVFQYPEYQLFEETVFKDVAFGPKNIGLADEELEDRVREAIELVGLDYEQIKDKSPFDLSGGQKRRVAIAGVIAMKPKVLILDEPTAGLDPKAHRDVLDMIIRVHEHENNITIMVSHNMEDIASMCDKVIVMDRAHAVMEGTPEEVFARRAELKQMGLAAPPVTELIDMLNDRGFKLDGNILTRDKAVEEIYKAIRGNINA